MVTPVGVYAQSLGEFTTQANGQLGKEDFLQILVQSMRNQDPINPVDNGEMIAQMATFSMLEAILNMSDSFVSLQSVTMLGKIVRATTSDGSVLEGRVTSVNFNKGAPILTLEDGSVVAMKDVFEVTF